MKGEKLEIKTNFTTRLEELRKAKKLSLGKMAEASFMAKANYIEIRDGKRVPGLYILCDLAHALGITVSELLKGVDPKP